MKRGHLRLVMSDNEYCSRKSKFSRYMEKSKEWLKCIVTSRREKIFILKDALIKIYRDYEISTGIADVPYYVRAELKMSKIIQEDKIDYYFRGLPRRTIS